MAEVSFYSEEARALIKRVVDEHLATRPDLGNTQRPGRAPVGSIPGPIVGVITRVTGTDQPRYDARGDKLPAVTVTNQRPFFRPFNASTKVTPAGVGDECLLFKDRDDRWRLALAHEVLATEACQGIAGAGTPNSSVVTAYSFQQRNGLEAIAWLDFSWTQTVTTGTNDQFGILLHTFPAGWISMFKMNLDATVISTANTDDIKLAIATSDVTGQNGTSFTAAYEDWCENILTRTVASSAVDYNRPCPATANTTPDAINLAALRDGLSADLEAWLNLSVASGTWGGNDDITVAGTIWFHWTNMGGTA